MTRPIVALISLVSFMGCAELGTLPGETTPETASGLCQRFPEAQTGGPHLPAIDAPREQQITGMACFTEHATPGDPWQRPYVQWHYRFDDRRPDPVLASMIVVNAASGDRWSYPYVLGQLDWYARENPPERVAAALANVAIADEIRQRYLERYADARALVLVATDALEGGDTAIVRDLPRAVRAQRAMYQQTFGGDLTAYDALMPELDAAVRSGRADRTLLDRAVDLRDRHVAACVAQTPFSTFFCWNGTFARPLTWAIAWMALLADDPVLAYAEADTFGRGVDLTPAAAQIAMAQQGAMDIGARYSFEVWRYPDRADPALAERVRALHDRLDWAGEAVGRTAVVGDHAAIHYSVRDSASVEYRCSDRVELRQVGSDIRAYRRCRTGRVDTDRTVTRPVTVPAADALGLEPGNFALTVFDPQSRRGRLVEARPTVYSEQRAFHRIRFTPLKANDASDRGAAERVITASR
ncbi:MAG: hypothetical protein HYY06_20695 [Deltaproteobacteria bacterium]|nr:hypothetical protein [Deltaproteobacteria bacterium]